MGTGSGNPATGKLGNGESGNRGIPTQILQVAHAPSEKIDDEF